MAAQGGGCTPCVSLSMPLWQRSPAHQCLARAARAAHQRTSASPGLLGPRTSAPVPRPGCTGRAPAHQTPTRQDTRCCAARRRRRRACWAGSHAGPASSRPTATARISCSRALRGWTRPAQGHVTAPPKRMAERWGRQLACSCACVRGSLHHASGRVHACRCTWRPADPAHYVGMQTPRFHTCACVCAHWCHAPPTLPFCSSMRHMCVTCCAHVHWPP